MSSAGGGAMRRTLAPLVSLTVSAFAAAPAQQSQLIAQWNRNVTEFRGQIGRRLTFICPPQGTVSGVYGTDTYTDDSPVCPAAAHAGVITVAAGGVVTIAIEPGQDSYQPSTRNGVASAAFTRWQGSYSILRPDATGRIDWSTTAAGLTPQLGRQVRLECPAGAPTGRVYGTDIYTDDSPICAAALHAGATTGAGGVVVVEAAGAQPSFQGSNRNGVASSPYEAWPNTFRFVTGSASTASSTRPIAASRTVTPTSSSVEATGAAAAAVVPTAIGSTQVVSQGRVTAVPVAAAGATRRSTAGAPPTGVNVAVSGVGAVHLRWTAAPGASGYSIAYGPRGSGAPTELATVPATATEKIVTGIRPGAIELVVSASYADRIGGASTPVGVAVPPVPQPGNFKAVSGPGYVELRWDSIPDAVGYLLSRIENGAAVPLDDHLPARSSPRVERASFIDATGPASTVGYVLATIYRDHTGAEYTSDAAAYPRTVATPLAAQAGTGDEVRITGFVQQYGTLVAKYEIAGSYGYVSGIFIEQLGPTGWKQSGGMGYSWSATDARFRPIPGGSRSGTETVDPNIPGGCEHRRVLRIRAEWSYGGGVGSPPATKSAERFSRPHVVTYDNPSWGCHR